MIGTITFFLAIAILGTSFGIFNLKNYYTEPNKYGDKELKTSSIVKLVIVIMNSY